MSSDSDVEIASAAEAQYGSEYRNHLLEQYKLYVEMADKISERRQAANTFFIGMCSALLGALGVTWPTDAVIARTPWFVLVSVVGILLCLVWYRLIRSYRDLNSAKFKVVGRMESFLPVRPYRAEWELVGEGKASGLYLPFTHIETRIPFAFVALFVAVAIAAPLTKGHEKAPGSEAKSLTTMYFEKQEPCTGPDAPIKQPADASGATAPPKK
jgi:hypothetical protein